MYLSHLMSLLISCKYNLANALPDRSPHILYPMVSEILSCHYNVPSGILWGLVSSLLRWRVTP